MAIQLREGRRSETGTATVEAAVVLPIFFLLLFGIFEAGHFMSVQQVITDAAREGARFAVAPLTGTNGPATESDVDAVVQQFLGSAGITGSTITFDPNVVDGTGTSSAHVHIDAPYNIFTMQALSVFNVTLHGDALMRNEASN